MILIDTHVFVWFVEGSDKLGRKARSRLERALARSEAHVSAISFWEIAMLAGAGRLHLSRDPGELRARALGGGLVEIPVDGEIGILAARLGVHGDPADRVIIATALARRATLMTADHAILDATGGPTCVDARQ